MNKIIVVLMMICIASVAFADSDDRTDYYNDGTYYIVDGLTSSDIPLDGGSAPNNGDALSTGGWTIEGSNEDYSSTYASSGTVSMHIDGDGNDAGAEYDISNSSFTGEIKYRWLFSGTPTNDKAWMTIRDEADDTSCMVGVHQSSTFDCISYADCPLNAPTVSSGTWYNISIDWTGGNTSPNIYIDGVHSASCANMDGLGLIDFDTLGNANGEQFIDEFRVCDGKCTDTSPVAGGAETIEFLPASAVDGDKNNTQVDFIFNSSTGKADFFFGTTNPPTIQFFDNVSTGDDGYTWTSNVTSDTIFYYYACVGDDCLINTSVQSWTYDSTEPPITLHVNSSFNITNQTHNVYQDHLYISYDITDNIDLFGTSINVTLANGTSYYDYFSESLSGTSASIAVNVSTANWPGAYYFVDIYASDSHTAKKIKNYSNQKKENKLEYDTAEGNFLSIESEDDADVDTRKSKIDRYNFEFNFKDDETKNRVFNIRSDKKIVYRPDSGYDGHFVVWNSKTKQGNWIDFEGVPGEITVKKINDYHYQVTAKNLKGGVKHEFKSIGGLNVNHKSYNFTKSYFNLTNVSISPTTPIASSNLDGIAYLSESHGLNSTVYYTWYKNGVFQSSGTKVTGPGSPIINSIDSSLTTVGELWTFSAYAIAGSVTSNTYNYTSNITGFEIDDCSGYSNVALNFSIYEENSRVLMPANVVANFNITDGSEYAAVQVDKDSVNNFGICLSTTDVSYIIDGYIQYENSDGEIRERYYLEDVNISGSTQYVSLYNFNSSSGISTLIAEADNATYRPQPGVLIQLQRYYPELNAFVTVQMDKSDELGNGIFYVYQYSIDYKMVFSSNGKTLYSTEVLKFNCETSTDCSQIFILPEALASDSYLGFSYNGTYDNSSDTYVLEWFDSNSLVSSVRLLVEQQTGRTPNTICDSTVTSSSGTILCNVTGYNGIISARAFRTASPSDPFLFEYVKEAVGGLSDYTGKSGAFLSFMIMVAAAGFGFYGAIPAVIASVFGLIIVFLFKIWSVVNLTMVIGGAALGVLVAGMLNSRGGRGG